MPVSVEVKYEYFFTWGGRIKIIELILGALCMMCAAPAFHSTQHWFLLVVVLGFIGTIYFTLHNLSLDAYLKNLALNFTQVVSYITNDKTKHFKNAVRYFLVISCCAHDRKFNFSLLQSIGILVHSDHYLSLFYCLHRNVSGLCHNSRKS